MYGSRYNPPNTMFGFQTEFFSAVGYKYLLFWFLISATERWRYDGIQIRIPTTRRKRRNDSKRSQKLMKYCQTVSVHISWINTQ